MARSNMKAEAFIKTNDGQEIPWYTVYEDGSVVWHLSEDKAKEYKRLMISCLLQLRGWKQKGS